MNFRIVERNSFVVVGKSALILQQEKYIQLPQFWNDCHHDGTIKMLHTFGGDTIIGVGENDGASCFRYMIGICSEKETPNIFDAWVVPASTWVIFESVLSTPEFVGPVWEYIFNDFLPNGCYDLAHTPDLEVNRITKNPAAQYTCEIWIPVVEKA